MRCTRPVLERCKTGPVEIVERPCGKCPACLANKAQEWTYRLYAENKLHRKSCFVTLTYSDDNLCRLHLSDSGLYSLSKREFQNFIKRLRKSVSERIRFYGVGEYGGQTKRPHFHAIIFGLGVSDRKLIEQAWPFGFVTVGDVSPSSIAYVARYCTKKLFSERLDYEKEGILPEFALMSNRPGIGFNAIKKGVRKTDDGKMFAWFQGRRIAVPAYFKQKLKSAYDVYVGRLIARREMDARLANDGINGVIDVGKDLQAEKNALRRWSSRKKL